MEDDGSAGSCHWDICDGTIAWAPIPKFEPIDPPTGYEIVPHEGYEFRDGDMIWEIDKWWSLADLQRKPFHHDLIARPIKPKSRPFRNAGEFRPFRDRWWRYKGDCKTRSRPPAAFDDEGAADCTWQECYDRLVFDDGSPFGIVE
jgi:hypothetical protein